MDSKTNIFKELDINSMAKGIDRKASDEELSQYLSRGIEAESINLNEAYRNIQLKDRKIDKNI